MVLDIQFKLKSNPNLLRYIRENSHWYKKLNREPESYSILTEEMKEKYKIRPSDKINNILEQIKLVQSLMGVMK
jgi:hypothetical protein